MAIITSTKDIKVYNVAYEAAMEIFRMTKDFPDEERFDLSMQIKRSSRSVVSNIVEAWRRRKYPKNFLSKLTDSEAEADETKLWLDFALDCRYITAELHAELSDKYDHILSMLVKIMQNKEKWCVISK
ncbi:MAG: four helix bundle protein [Bacteroidales bacterium]|jgi:four helix bundle protein|nr:four helix bundle protein [Bacteroidales bacterium]